MMSDGLKPGCTPPAVHRGLQQTGQLLFLAGGGRVLGQAIDLACLGCTLLQVINRNRRT